METRLRSRSKEVVISLDRPFVMIGERINPTGRKVLAAEMKAGVMERVKADAIAQVEAGAQMLDVNAGVPGIDEPALLVQAIKAVSEVTDVPLCIDSSVIEALEAALAVYEGKALVNSVTAEDERMDRILPLVKKYGAAVIGMSNDETGITMVPQERVDIARRIIDRARHYGIPQEDVIIDPIAMTVAADPQAGLITLETMRLIKEQLGNNMTCGASNVSFGLPDRHILNAAFFPVAMHSGLTCAITNPLVPEVRKAVLASDLLLGHDEYAMRWISNYRNEQKTKSPSPLAGEGRGWGVRSPQTSMIQKKLEVTYQPFGKSTRVPPGTTLFSAAHWIGLPIDSTCGGRGTCGKCKVQIAEADSEITAADRKQLRAAEIDTGWRLSCQAKVYHDMSVKVPELLRVPKAATMGVNRLVLLDPNVRKVYVELIEPDLEDQRSDAERLADALTAEGFDMKVDLPLLRRLPSALRDAAFKVTAVIGGDRLIAVEPGDTREESYGVAFDLGTTTVVGTLMNLRTGMAEAVGSTLNGQAPFGADVISRISHGMQGEDARQELREAVLRTMNGILQQLYASADVTRERVYELVVVGNATMLHLLLGIDATPISMMPFTPAFREPLYLPARDVGLDIHPDGYVQSLPIIGAYVGADIVAGVVATGLAREEKLRVMVDVGTNGEIVLGSTKRVLCTAAPAGPAFEGSQIKCGMRATDGAIEGVTLTDRVELQVIGGDVAPRGICGSGLVDIVAQLLVCGLLDASGKLKSRDEVPEHPLSDRLITVEGVRAFLLAPDVYLTQRDVRELQFAKGSIATGIKVLMDVMGVTADDLDEVLLAGSFGSYLNPESAKIIGLVPPVHVDRILSVGNTAGEGAKMSLLSFRERQVAFELPEKIEYVELSGRSDFNDSFVSVLRFPELREVA